MPSNTYSSQFENHVSEALGEIRAELKAINKRLDYSNGTQADHTRIIAERHAACAQRHANDEWRDDTLSALNKHHQEEKGSRTVLYALAALVGALVMPFVELMKHLFAGPAKTP